MTGLYQDVKFSLRMMAKSPGFTFVVIITLALGVGVNSAGFSLANAAWWQKVPFPNPKEIVVAAIADAVTEPSHGQMAYAEFADVRSRAKSFKAIAAYSEQVMVLSSEGKPGERYRGAAISPNLFSFLGMKSLLGRD